MESTWIRRYDDSFIKKRRLQLDEYLDDLLSLNPGLKDDFDMQAFLYFDEEKYKKYLNKTNYLKVVYKGISKYISTPGDPECLSSGTDFSKIQSYLEKHISLLKEADSQLIIQ